LLRGYDKKGSRIKKIIIEPALDYIREELVNFCKKKGGSSKTNILKQMIAANSVIQIIDSGELSDKINRYIALRERSEQVADLNFQLRAVRIMMH
jgi:hypothetical protein